MRERQRSSYAIILLTIERRSTRRKVDKMEFNKSDKFVAYRIATQRMTPEAVKNGVFMFGQIPDDGTYSDAYALNWAYIGEAASIDEAKAELFKLRAECMKKSRGKILSHI